MKITICGSVTFMPEFEKLKRDLLELGFKEVFVPKGFGDNSASDKELKDRLTIEEDGQRKIDHDLIRRHSNLIMKSDCILVGNYDKKGTLNYIGGNTFLEMGFAFIAGKPIFVLNPLPDLPYSSEMNGMEPIILEGDIGRIKDYYSL